ncbi:site-2 protease family protein [Polyangium sp. 15x6]|uniref:site-2 protease family protein n=1 Tax=Polyangium sp. 15x6 TaxID=3042687 RepID=UPI00249C3D4D|nr:site-2 protease family protein [Polyangium sp. 15x6]MDI3282082.1 site-2 protease family protein [Polyangium sp. 15x6]
MNFRLFGIDVEVQASFWFSTVLLGISFVDLSRGPAGLVPLALWAFVVLVSVLMHEFGHALAIRRYRIQPEITLFLMGGVTRWQQVLPLRRIDHIFISLAGPLAGFAFAGPFLALDYWLDHHASTEIVARVPSLVRSTITLFIYVNVRWGLINLLPVLPLDGGHVLEHALGPRRVRLVAGLSMLAGFAVALYGLRTHNMLLAMMFGMLAFQSLRRMQMLGPGEAEEDPRPHAPAPDTEPALSGEQLSLLLRARQAVADEDLGRARSLVQEIFSYEQRTGEPLPPRARREAFEVLGWVALVSDHVDEAAQRVAEARKLGEVDPALVGAVHFAKRELNAARRVLEAARAAGDDRKEIVGPLVQILLEQGEVARAAAIAYDIVDSLSEDDARKMAKLAFEGRAFDWSARLSEAVFERQKSAEDAYEAARAHAQDGAYERALDMLRKAVEAGFSDRGRVWSDKALEALRTRSGLEAVVPRP